MYKEILTEDGVIDGSAVKGSSFSFRRHRFDFQKANGGSQPFIALAAQDVRLSFGLCEYQHAYGEYEKTLTQINQNFQKLERNAVRIKAEIERK